MEIIKVTSKEYEQVIGKHIHVFQNVSFNELNRDKCDELLFFLFKEGKYKLGIILGVKDSSLYSPFSAPFGGFSFLSSNVKLSYIENAIKELKNWAKVNGFSSVNITLPPDIYEPGLVSKQVNCLWREGFEMSEIDLNYALHLNSFDNNYLQNIQYNARKNLKVALKSDLEFVKCSDPEEKEQAYDVIKKNREQRGFPLRMTWKQVKETTNIIDADFFLLKHEDNIPVASAVVFHVAPEIVQVIYWGDIHEYSHLRTMNMLSFKVFEYYKNKNIKIVDIGPSTENSVPNYGLAEFKESIGCTVSTKFKFVYKF